MKRINECRLKDIRLECYVPSHSTSFENVKRNFTGVEDAFGIEFSNRFNIHRTRKGFPNNGIDTFEAMAKKGVWIIDRVIQEEFKGGFSESRKFWVLPVE